MKALNLLLLGMVLLPIQAFGQSSLFPVEKVDSFITKRMRDWHTMGVAISIIKDDTVLVSKGYGYRDYARKLPITGNTVFPIASCTKTFTAALMMMAAMENKIALDSPVHRYFPEFELYSDELTQQATVQDLLSHRTGLAGHDWAWTFNTNFKDEVYLKRIKHLEPFAGLRMKFQYNNFMYFALGALGTRLYHKNWNDLVREKFFHPLEMSHSYPSHSAMDESDNIALTYEYEDSFRLQETKQMDDLMGAGSINSTAGDLARWLRMWIQGGVYKEHRLLSPEFVRKAISSHIVVNEGLSDQYPDEHFMNMGLSWFLSSYRGHYRAHHTGNVAGFSSMITFFPYDRVGLVVLTNQNNSPLLHLVSGFIADLLLDLPIRDKNSAMLVRRDSLKSKLPEASFINLDTVSTQPLLPLINYSGSFLHPGYGSVRIDPYKKALLLKYFDLELMLLPSGANRFSSHYFEENKISTFGVGDVLFNLDEGGNIQSFNIPLEPAVKDIQFNRY